MQDYRTILPDHRGAPYHESTRSKRRTAGKIRQDQPYRTTRRDRLAPKTKIDYRALAESATVRPIVETDESAQDTSEEDKTPAHV